MKMAPKLTALFLLLFFPLTAGAGEKIAFDQVIDRVTRNAFDVEIAETDIRISEASRKETLSLYYPTLKGKWNSEYIKDLTGNAGEITSVGNSVFGESTGYRNSYSLNAEWLLYDFGARENRLALAEKDIEAQKVAYTQSIREVRLKTLRIYTELLQISRELEANKTLLALQKELVSVSERLRQAGLLLQTDMVDDLLKTIKTLTDMEALTARLKKAFHELSLFTRDTYKSEDIEIEDFPETDRNRVPFSREKLPEYRFYELEIEKKKNELAILKKDCLPRFDFYSGYIWYGKDTGAFAQSVQNIKEQNYMVGIAATINFFGRFRTRAQIEKATLEIEKLSLEKEKKIEELATKYRDTDEAIANLAEEVNSRKEMIRHATDKLSMTERLTLQQVSGEKEFLTQKIELLNEQTALRRVQIDIQSARIERMLLATGAN
jgi:outer membrane protein